MVKIQFWRDKDKGSIHMKVKGHAETAPKGEDLVCAAATMLVYTVAQAVSFMYETGQLKEKPSIKIREGSAYVVAKPKEDFFAETIHTYWVAQCGAHVLARNHPEAVSLNHLTM